MGLVASFTDSDPQAVPSNFTAAITWGDGQSSPGIITNRVGGGFNVTGTNTYASSNQTFLVQTTITQTATHQITIANGSATVTNASLTISNPSPTTSVVGQPLQILATLTDGNLSATPGNYAVTINWGDGTPLTPALVSFGTNTTSPPAVTFNVTGTHTYAQSGSDVIVITATRTADQRVVTGTANVTVTSNALLTPIATTITPVAGVPFTNVVVGSFTASPPNQSGFVATINWGDTQSSIGIVVPQGGGLFNVVGSHVYGAATAAGTSLPVTVTVVEPSRSHHGAT